MPTSHFFEGLGEGQAPAKSVTGVHGVGADEVGMLTGAFGAISDAGTRASVLALVKSLADEDKTRLRRGEL